MPLTRKNGLTVNLESNDSEKKAKITVSGILVTGSKKAAFFTQLEWVKRQFLNLLGFEPFPGTLNLMLSEQDEQVMEEIRQRPGIPLISPDASFCQSRAYPVRIGTISGAVILPEEKVRIHGQKIVEIMAPVSLRESLHLQDGNRVDFVIEF
jgi:CTP-dependent riboflavin kinase